MNRLEGRWRTLGLHRVHLCVYPAPSVYLYGTARESVSDTVGHRAREAVASRGAAMGLIFGMGIRPFPIPASTFYTSGFITEIKSTFTDAPIMTLHTRRMVHSGR